MIQSCWRFYKARSDFAKAMMCLRCDKSAVTVQSCWRFHKARRDFAKAMIRLRRDRSAVMMQSCWRICKARRDFAKAMESVNCLQRWFQNQLEKKRRACAALRIQCVVRSHMQRNAVIKHKKHLICNSIKIQSAFRRYLAIQRLTELRFIIKVASPITVAVFRRQFHTLRVNALREFRAMYEAEHTKKLQNAACKVLQKWLRERLRKIFILKNNAAMVIQKCFHRYKRFCEVKRLSSIIIQACMRRHLAKRALEKEAATKMQSCFRGYRDFVRFQMKIYSAIQMQTCIRGYQARCANLPKLKELKQKRNNFAVQIQTFVRFCQAQETLQRLKQEKTHHRAATAIQKTYRGYRKFVTFVIMQYFVIKIQAYVRGNLARCRVKRLNWELRYKQILRSKTISDDFLLARKEKHHLHAADDISLSSVSCTQSDASFSSLSECPSQSGSKINDYYVTPSKHPQYSSNNGKSFSGFNFASRNGSSLIKASTKKEKAAAHGVKQTPSPTSIHAFPV